MSSLHNYVTRNNAAASTPRNEDPSKQARQLELRRANGWVNSEGSSPTPSSPAVSQRQKAAAFARIKPVRYGKPRNESLPPEGFVKASQYRHDNMSPLPRPVSTTEVDAQSNHSHQNGRDMFDTDLDNADATTTISDLSPEEVAQAIALERKSTGLDTQTHFADHSDYEESLEEGPEEGESSVADSCCYGSGGMDGERSDDDANVNQGSNVNGSQYGSNKAFHGFGPLEQMDAAYSTHQTPKPREQSLKPFMDSPSAKKALAVRTSHRDGRRPAQAKGMSGPMSRAGRSRTPFAAEAESMPYSKAVEGIPQKRPTAEVEQWAAEQGIRQIKREYPGNSFNAESYGLLHQVSYEPKVSKQNLASQVTQVKQEFANGTSAEIQSPKFDNENVIIPVEPDQLHAEPKDVQGTTTFPEFDLQTANGEEVKLNTKDPVVDAHIEMTASVETKGQEKARVSQDNGITTKGTRACQDAKPQAKLEDSRKRPLGIDYDQEQLAGMNFKLLQTESFDHDPKRTISAFPSDLAQAPLAAKLSYIYDLKDKDNAAAQRQGAFSNLKIDQYEEAGDLVIERFTNILNRYKEARREKREAARNFEKEVAEREERVRSKTTTVEKDMDGLKRGATEIIRGKRS